MSEEYALCTVCTVRTGLIVPSRITIINTEERRQYEGHNMPLGLDQFDSLELFYGMCTDFEVFLISTTQTILAITHLNATVQWNAKEQE